MTSFQSPGLTELPVVENSQLFAQRVHRARYAPKQEKPPLPCLEPCQPRTPLATFFGGENCPLQLLASSFMVPCAPALLRYCISPPPPGSVPSAHTNS